MKILMAPMEGVVDHLLRRLYSLIGGLDEAVTEFVRVTDTRLPEKVFKRYCPELGQPLSIPVNVQLLGSQPRALAFNAHKVALMGAPSVDLNFGCPAKTVNRHRGGACLLTEPQLIYDIVHDVRQAVPASTPVTAKIRLGYAAREHYVDNALAIEQAGAQRLVVHARSKADGYRPPAYWHCIGEIRQAVNLPIVANGDIWSVADYVRCQQESGCEDVMLGRGLLARPDLALAIKAEVAGEPYQPLPWARILPLVHAFHSATVDQYPKKYCGNRLKQWLMYLRRHYPQAELFFNRIKRLRDPVALEHEFQLCLAGQAGGANPASFTTVALNNPRFGHSLKSTIA